MPSGLSFFFITYDIWSRCHPWPSMASIISAVSSIGPLNAPADQNRVWMRTTRT